MEELELKMNINGEQSIASNLDGIKKGLEDMVAVFKDYRVSEGNISESKKTLADLRKAEKALEDERKRLKSIWQKPYAEWEKLYEDAISPLEETIGRIADGVSAIDKSEEEKRIIGRRGFLETLLAPINAKNGVNIRVDQIWESSWKNKSLDDKKFTLEATEKIGEIMRGFAALRNRDKAVRLRFSETLDLADAFQFESALEAVPECEEIAEPGDEKSDAPLAPPGEKPYPSFTFTFKENYPPEDAKEVLIITRTFKGAKWKLAFLFDIAKRMGVFMKTVKKEKEN